MTCTECGKNFEGKIYPSGMCQACYLYFHKGGTVNTPPPAGVIAKDYRGYVVCHICGRAYKRLGSHIKESHSMTITEYKKEFGLCNNAKTTEVSYSNHMHNLAYKYNMPQRLQETGRNTRIKKGERDKRLGKEVRLQERIDKSKRHTTSCDIK